MPIVSISRIQHRYGLSENIPQLSAAELGWVIDQRKLYIGNGPTSEGAPEVGNTEILTEYSDILSLAQSYTYKGEAAGYVHATGPDANSPIVRSLQTKFDDMASVKDFGAKGDGVTDDTDAINRALYEMFCKEINVEIRRSLFFPAGIYKVTDEIKIPTYAKIYGEGQNASIIRQTDSDPICVARVADSLQQVGANIGNNAATLPQYIDVVDMTFEQTTSNNVFIINSTSSSRFHRVGFKGSLSGPAGAGSELASLSIYSTAANHSNNITFEQCEFTNNNFGLLADDDSHNMNFNGCRFTDLYKGIKLGEATTGFGSAVEGPTAYHVTGSYFDDIYSYGIQCYTNIKGFYSSFNYFDDVGNRYSVTPYDNNILFSGSGCSTILDTFTRSDADNITVPRINLNNKSNIAMTALSGLSLGRRLLAPAVPVTLPDNTLSGNTGITFSATTEKSVRIYYTASRATNQRHGEIMFTASSAGSTISDTYQYDGGDVGLTFDISISSGTTSLLYSTTNTGTDVTFVYGIEKM